VFGCAQDQAVVRNLAGVDQVVLDVLLTFTAQFLQLLQIGACRRFDFFFVNDFGGYLVAVLKIGVAAKGQVNTRALAE
jgi:hypothetical protein